MLLARIGYAYRVNCEQLRCAASYWCSRLWLGAGRAAHKNNNKKICIGRAKSNVHMRGVLEREYGAVRCGAARRVSLRYEFQSEINLAN